MSGRCGGGYIVQLGRSGRGYMSLHVSKLHPGQKETMRLVISDAKS